MWAEGAGDQDSVAVPGHRHQRRYQSQRGSHPRGGLCAVQDVRTQPPSFQALYKATQ